MTWRNFVLVNGATVADPPRGVTHRLAAEGEPIYKSMLRLDGAFHPDLIVDQGSHSVRHLGRPLRGVPLQNLPLWHFPVRSQAQLTAKAVVGWLACLAANPRAFEGSRSIHWQGMFRRIVDGAGLDDLDLHKLSLHYADNKYAGVLNPSDLATMHDLAPIDTVRRYSTKAFLDPLILVARSWEKSLRAQDRCLLLTKLQAP